MVDHTEQYVVELKKRYEAARKQAKEAAISIVGELPRELVLEAMCRDVTLNEKDWASWRRIEEGIGVQLILQGSVLVVTPEDLDPDDSMFWPGFVKRGHCYFWADTGLQWEDFSEEPTVCEELAIGLAWVEHWLRYETRIADNCESCGQKIQFNRDERIGASEKAIISAARLRSQFDEAFPVVIGQNHESLIPWMLRKGEHCV